MGATLRNETALLLHLVRGDEPDPEPFEVSLHSIDWSLLRTVASRHGLILLLNRRLQTFTPSFVPTAFLNELSSHCQSLVRRNLALSAELLVVLDLFCRRGIDAMPFKGPVLSAALYGGPLYRAYADLDILVRDTHLESAQDVLKSRGYRSREQLSATHQRVWDAAAGVSSMIHVTRNLTLELHCRLAPRQFGFALGFDHIWSRRMPVRCFERTLYTFSDEISLVFLCAHGGKHLWERLEWIYGVSELIRHRPTLDWEEVLRLATTLGYRRALHIGMILALQLFHTPCPKDILAEFAEDTNGGRLARILQEHLYERAGPHSALEYFAAYQLLRERWRDKARLLLILVAPGIRDMELFRLPKCLFWLYPLFRGIRLSYRYLIHAHLVRLVNALSAFQLTFQNKSRV